jgi:hypothetical protein
MRVAGLRPPTENSSAPSAGRRPRCYYLIDRPSMLSISGRALSCHLQPISGRTEGVESLSLGRWLIEVMCRLPSLGLCIGKEPLPATANLRDLREIRQGEDIDAYMDDCLRPYMDEFAVYYLDDILINSEDPSQHKDHVRRVFWTRFVSMACIARLKVRVER